MPFTPPPVPDAVPAEALAVARALLTRRSVRAFLPRSVSREIVEAMLSLAARAPSGTNCQPWKVYVCAGETKRSLTEKLLTAHYAGGDEHKEEYRYYPLQWREPYLSRRRTLGWALYGLVGVAKGDRPAMMRQHARNYEFFGAPVGLFFTIDRDLELGSWLDTGMFIENVMIAARVFGLDTCPQAAFNAYHRIIAPHLGIPDGEMLVCGMSLGYADPNAPANALTPEREPVAAFTRFQGDWSRQGAA